jgi:hypothetical protein
LNFVGKCLEQRDEEDLMDGLHDVVANFTVCTGHGYDFETGKYI